MLSPLFRSPRRRAGSFSLHAQRKVTKRKGTLASRSPDILSVDCASGLRGSLTARPVPTTNARASVHAPLRAFSSTRSPGRKGNPGRAQARALLRAQSGALPTCLPRLLCLALLPLLGSPSAPAGGGRKGPQGGRDGSRPLRRQCADALSAQPGRRSRTRGASSRGRRCGVSFSLVTFSWTSTAPQERREQRSWPEGRRAGCPESQKVTRSPPRRAEPLRKRLVCAKEALPASPKEQSTQYDRAARRIPARRAPNQTYCSRR